VNGQDSKAEIFDVFLCHNSEDKPAVREIAQQLVKEGIKPWLDEHEIRPGTSWQTALEQQIESIKSAAVFVGDRGVGPWQRPEIQAFLNQFVKRECAVIPVVLDSVEVTPKLPLMLENLQWVDFRVTDSYPLQRLIWGITGEKPVELAHVPFSQKSATKGDAGKITLLPSGDDHAAAHKVASVDLNQDEVGQLEILRRRVKEYWVDGVLKHSLYNEVLISLGKRQIDEAVDAPWKYTVELSDATASASLDERDVSAIYDATGLLLILGEPGSGKTTTLLDLARTLLDRARDDIKKRVPVVLNLSTWKEKEPLAEWIAVELSNKYRVPRKIARFWLENGHLLPVLDGLDEIETSMQPDCVAAINAFIEELKPSGLVVCCRLNEYRWLPERLKLNGAICLESLSPEEVNKYLGEGGSTLAALREAANTDPVLQELAQTPLMLSIMSLAYQGVGSDELGTQKGDSIEERRKQIFRLYVEQMFQRKGTASLVFPKEKTIGWLSWLAGRMRKHSQSVFLVEGLQPSWLGTRAKRVAYGTVVALSLALIFALIFTLIFTRSNGLIDKLIQRQLWGMLGGIVPTSEGYQLMTDLSYELSGGLTGNLQGGPISGLIGGPISGLIGGLIGGLIFGLIILVGAGLGCWSKSRLINGVVSGAISGLIGLSYWGIIVEPMPEHRRFGLIYGLIYGLLVGLISGLGVGSLNDITSVETMSWKWNRFWKRTIFGSIFGLIFGLIFRLSGSLGDELSGSALIYLLLNGLSFGLFGGLISGLAGGLTDRVKVDKAYPNQGIKLSGKNALTALLVTCLSTGLIGGMLIGGMGLFTSQGPLSDAYDYWGTRYRASFDGLTAGMFGGLIGGLIAGLNRGGSAVIKHYALRLILSWKGYTPFNFIKFLDHCAKLIFLKKVGGGYIFVHRMLLEYFADLPTIEKSAESKRT
jgi:hypothetical protein